MRETLLAIANVIMIDVVLSGDNALIIGMITKDIPLVIRKKVILGWVLGAAIMRLIFAWTVMYLLSFIGIKMVGGILLLYVVWKIYRTMRTDSGDHHVPWPKTTVWSALFTIIVADVTLSLDNVLAVAGAANSAHADHGTIVLIIGLVVSILLMLLASNWIANKLEKYPNMQRVGILIILFVAITMMMEWSTQLLPLVHINMMPWVVVWSLGLFIRWHRKVITPYEEQKVKDRLTDHYTIVFIVLCVIILGVVLWWSVISIFLQSHIAWLYIFVMLMVMVICELYALHRQKRQFKKLEWKNQNS